MLLSAQPPHTPIAHDLAQAKERLVSVRDALKQACRDVESQIAVLERLGNLPAMESVAVPPKLFETPPVNVQQAPVTEALSAHSRVIKAAAPAALDPALEQATLEELNAALSKAFAQIASRAEW